MLIIYGFWDAAIHIICNKVHCNFKNITDNKKYNCKGHPPLKVKASLSAFKKSAQFINSFSRYSRF